MSRFKARRSKVRKIMWAQGYRLNVFRRLFYNNLYGLSPTECVLKAIDEWSTLAQVAAMEKELPEIQRVIQRAKDAGQLR